MVKTFAQANLTIEYLHKPDSDKGEKNPFLSNDPQQSTNPYIKSSKVEIPEEILPELIHFLEEKGVFMGHVKGISN